MSETDKDKQYSDYVSTLDEYSVWDLEAIIIFMSSTYFLDDSKICSE